MLDVSDSNPFVGILIGSIAIITGDKYSVQNGSFHVKYQRSACDAHIVSVKRDIDRVSVERSCG